MWRDPSAHIIPHVAMVIVAPSSGFAPSCPPAPPSLARFSPLLAGASSPFLPCSLALLPHFFLAHRCSLSSFYLARRRFLSLPSLRARRWFLYFCWRSLSHSLHLRWRSLFSPLLLAGASSFSPNSAFTHNTY